MTTRERRVRRGAPLAALAALFATGCPAGSDGARASAEVSRRADTAAILSDRCQRASLALERGDPQAAIRELQLAMSLDPGAARVQVLRGMAYRHLGQPREARAAFERALGQDPGHADVETLGEAAECMLELGDAAAALQVLDRDRTNAPALRLIEARAREARGDLDGALAAARAALDGGSPPPGARELLARLEASVQERERGYGPRKAPERLSDASLSLEGGARLRLPRGFTPGGTARTPRARRGGVTISLASAARPEVTGEPARAAFEASARELGQTLVACRALALCEREALLVHVIEPGPESGVVAPFDLVRYEWFVPGPGAGVRLRVEAEVARGARDLEPQDQEDIFAALATLEVPLP